MFWCNARAGSLGLGKPHSAVQSHIHGNNMQCILTFNKNVRQKHPYKELQPSQHQESLKVQALPKAVRSPCPPGLNAQDSMHKCLQVTGYITL